MAMTRRERQREATIAEIKSVARQQMAQYGTAGLSIRAIAGAMGLTPPALYRYFDNLNELITQLIVENFNALADALAVARDESAGQGGSSGVQMMAALLAYRRWALLHPVDFQLIYGNPIPGYEAPREVTVAPASRTLRIFTELCVAMLASGEIRPTGRYARIPPELEATLQDSLKYAQAPEEHTLALYFGVIGWPRIHGIIMLELFGHIGPIVGDLDVFYRIQVENLMHDLGYRT